MLAVEPLELRQPQEGEDLVEGAHLGIVEPDPDEAGGHHGHHHGGEVGGPQEFLQGDVLVELHRDQQGQGRVEDELGRRILAGVPHGQPEVAVLQQVPVVAQADEGHLARGHVEVGQAELHHLHHRDHEGEHQEHDGGHQQKHAHHDLRHGIGVPSQGDLADGACRRLYGRRSVLFHRLISFWRSGHLGEHSAG